ncbi:MAG: hypothetical protein FJ100_21930, partial [Deltaproteobacteria bacterium]|nr:hypothetical protein [Deltaproteobacteria bacterium]
MAVRFWQWTRVAAFAWAMSLGSACSEAGDPDASTAHADASVDSNGAEIKTTCPGGYGCACNGDDQCPEDSQCADTVDGPRCAERCLQGVCAAGSSCTTVFKTDSAGNPKKTVELCIAKWPRLCDPCTTSSQCRPLGDKTSNCVDIDGSGGSSGWYCASACAADAECPAAYGCKTVTSAEGESGKQCVPNSLQCTCSVAASAAKLQTSCLATAAGADKPSCKGTRACAIGGLAACMPLPSTPEVCNGLDDDCDGKIDNPKDKDGKPTLAACLDGDPCTDDGCDPKAGCSHLVSAAPCDDGDACTKGDVCDVTGACAGTAADCTDKSPCTSDSCDKQKGCQYTANAAPCEDGDACTVDDACSLGKCAGKAIVCDDANPCTVDSCDTKAGCANTAAALPCDDGNACTQADACAGANCSGAPKVCDDGLPCTGDVCDPTSGCATKLSENPYCKPSKLPVAVKFHCGEPVLQAWVLAVEAAADPTAVGLVQFKVDKTPVGLSAPPTACALNVNNGKDLACGPGQTALQAHATSPQYDLADLAPGTPLVLQFESAGTWSSAKATVQWRSGGAAWSDLATVLPGAGSYAKTKLNAGPLAGKVVQLRLLFNGPCGDSGPGWFVRNLALYADACAVAAAGGPSACNVQASCAMGDGGQTLCTCNPGFNGDGLSCVDLDECALNTAGCHKNATCTNLPGSFGCACKVGWSGDGKACVDIDECKLGTSGCSTNAKCINALGSYACECLPGYAGDGKNCNEDDECGSGVAGCHKEAICQNSPGGFVCKCKAGFLGDGKACTDVDECATGTAGCSKDAVCSNSPGAFACACKPGFQGDGKVCADIDECAVATAGCHKDASCTNTAGGATCTCKPGFVGDGKACVDVDECSNGTASCDKNATCANTPGSFACTCNAGYSGSGKACADIDECATSTAGCDKNANCANTLGSATCTCKPGFAGNGKSCVDIDECAAGTAGCAASAVCANTPGAFTCTCKPGYTGDGKTCVTLKSVTFGYIGGVVQLFVVPAGVKELATLEVAGAGGGGGGNDCHPGAASGAGGYVLATKVPVTAGVVYSVVVGGGGAPGVGCLTSAGQGGGGWPGGAAGAPAGGQGCSGGGG